MNAAALARSPRHELLRELRTRPPEQWSAIGRFWSRVEKVAGHWLWRGRLRRGVPTFKLLQQALPAQRVAWLLVHGSVVAGRPVRSICGETLCVNPAHLAHHAERPAIPIAASSRQAAFAWLKAA